MLKKKAIIITIVFFAIIIFMLISNKRKSSKIVLEETDNHELEAEIKTESLYDNETGLYYVRNEETRRSYMGKF